MIRFLSVSISMLILCGLTLTADAYDWALQNPYPTTLSFSAVDFINPTTGWAVGQFDAVLKTVDGGVTWTALRQLDYQFWNDVQFLDDQHGWILGSGPAGSAKYTSDGGITWIPRSPNSYSVSDGCFVSPTLGWAATGHILYHTTDGNNWVPQRIGTSSWDYTSVTFHDSLRGWTCGQSQADSQIVVSRTDDGGSTWTDYRLGGGFWVRQKMCFPDSVAGWIGVTALANNGYQSTTLFKTTDGGQTWDSQLLDVQMGIENLFFLDSQIGWVCCDLATLHTTDGGLHWAVQDTILANPIGIDAIDANTAWQVGQSGQIRKTTNGGSTWTAMDRGPHCTFRSVSFIGQTEGWALGDWSVMVHTTDAGVNWQTLTSPLDDFYGRVVFADAAHGWVSGSGGAISRTTDGGESWQTQTLGWHQTLSVYPLNASDVWAAGYQYYPGQGDSSVILHSTDGGVNWQLQFENLGQYVNKVYMLNSQIGWAVGSEGLALRTSDGGTTWNTAIISSLHFSLRDVCFPDPLHGWIVGSTMEQDSVWLSRTTDGGDTWEWIDIRQNFDDEDMLYGVTFTDSLRGWLLGWPDILRTTDGGNTWQRTISQSNSFLHAMCIVNDSLGWAVGGDGAILRYGSPSLAVASTHAVAEDFSLSVYPNPFNSTTRIRYELTRDGDVSLRILNILGQEIATLHSGIQLAGHHEARWDASAVSSGIYFAVLQSGHTQKIQKLVLMK